MKYHDGARNKRENTNSLSDLNKYLVSNRLNENVNSLNLNESPLIRSN